MMDKVRFELHTPEVVTLRTPGRIVEGRFGRQTFYALADGRALYLDLDVSQKLNVLDVQPGESVSICKRGKGHWDVNLTPETERLRAAKGEREDRPATLRVPVLAGASRAALAVVPSEPAKPATAAALAADLDDRHNHRINDHDSTLIDESNALVDAYAAVLDRALKTYNGRVKPEEIRSIVLSCYISRSKKGGNHAAA